MAALVSTQKKKSGSAVAKYGILL